MFSQSLPQHFIAIPLSQITLNSSIIRVSLQKYDNFVHFWCKKATIYIWSGCLVLKLSKLIFWVFCKLLGPYTTFRKVNGFSNPVFDFNVRP